MVRHMLQMNYAQPELQALLEQGIEPFKRWLREDMARAHPATRFHANRQPDETLVGYYLAKFLPRLPPTQYYSQDVIVIDLSQYAENDCYNRIYTQISGNCLLPDDFHRFLFDLTHAFGENPFSAHDMLYWLEHDKAPEQREREDEVRQNPRLLASIADVEVRLGGTVERGSLSVLSDFSVLQWAAVVTVARQGYETRGMVHVKGETVTSFDQFQTEHMAACFNWLRARRYINVRR